MLLQDRKVVRPTQVPGALLTFRPFVPTPQGATAAATGAPAPATATATNGAAVNPII